MSRFCSITAAEGNMRSFREGLEGEKLLPDYASLIAVAALPNFLRPVVKLVLPKRIGHLLDCGRKSETNLATKTCFTAIHSLYIMLCICTFTIIKETVVFPPTRSGI